MKFAKTIVFVLMIALLLAACGKPEEPDQIVSVDSEEVQETQQSGEPRELVVMTHDSFAISEELIKIFEESNDMTVSFIKSGDTGAALNRAILSKETPIADVFYGLDNTFLSRALDEDLFETYESSLLSVISPEFLEEGDAESARVVPIDFGDVCINYDKEYFWNNPVPVPTSLEDLLEPEYEGLLVVENPATSSPGLAFLLATVAHFGEEGYLDYWAGLRQNGLVVASDWESAYYSNFSHYAGEGGQPLVVSYGTSPAAEWMFAEEELIESPTGSLVGEDLCFRQIEYAGILKGTENHDLATLFIDFLLMEDFQTDLMSQMFVFPVSTEVEWLPEFRDVSRDLEEPVWLDPATIAEGRERWIQAWDETVLR